MEGVDGGEGGGEGKISPMCESIGHRPLWGRCPKRTSGENEKTSRKEGRVGRIKGELDKTMDT